MSINERVKIIRTELNLNQQAFAKRIGIGQAAISAIEKGIRNITEQTILLICQEFNVNENWLRTNKGDIFNSSHIFSIDEYAEKHNASELDIEIIKIYLGLDKEIREKIMFQLKNAIYNHDKKVIDVVPARGGIYEIEETKEYKDALKKHL